MTKLFRSPTVRSLALAAALLLPAGLAMAAPDAAAGGGMGGGMGGGAVGAGPADAQRGTGMMQFRERHEFRERREIGERGEHRGRHVERRERDRKEFGAGQRRDAEIMRPGAGQMRN